MSSALPVVGRPVGAVAGVNARALRVSSLTLARRITELHGGQFTLQSQRGTGTAVSVQLPEYKGE